MDEDANTMGVTTRREYVKYGGAIVGGGLLAGCTSGGEEDEDGNDPESEGSYTVELFPVGEVTFEEVPETWMATYRSGWGDMAVAAGKADGCRTPTMDRLTMWYDEIGVDLDTDWPDFWNNGWSKEPLYELDADVHLIDPKSIESYDSWDESDTEEIEANIGPFFGCYNRRTTENWQLDLDYSEKAPSMLEAFEKVGEAFQERERVEAFLSIHEEMRTEVDDRLDEVESVSVGLFQGQPEQGTFYPLPLSDSGYEMKTYRDLDANDAFEGYHDGRYDGGELDYEGLLEIDPEILVVHDGILTTDGGHFDPEAFHDQTVVPMEQHPVGSELTAVQNGDVYPGPFSEQGPIVNLFQTELTAQQLYPEQFGAFDPDTYPEVPEEYQLFDRQRVADIINGNI